MMPSANSIQPFFLRKMRHELDSANQVHYSLHCDETQSEIDLNQQLGSKIAMKFLGNIQCVACSRSIKKTFNSGYCYPCLMKLAECDTCIIKPELCHYDKGTCRDNGFAEQYCNINHSLYLSVTSDIKVGITRQKREVSRWIDQGATQALRVLSLKRRYHAGLIEAELSKSMKDKTDWRKMLKAKQNEHDLESTRANLRETLPSLIEFVYEASGEDLSYINIQEITDIQTISYPVLKYPEKITSFNFDSKPIVEGVLQGIKAQYLIFDTGVINLKKFAGYQIEITGDKL